MSDDDEIITVTTDPECFGWITAPPSLFDYDTLARYNAERSRGIVHHPEWVARMAQIQDHFNDDMSRRWQAEALVRGSKPRRRWWR